MNIKLFSLKNWNALLLVIASLCIGEAPHALEISSAKSQYAESVKSESNQVQKFHTDSSISWISQKVTPTNINLDLRTIKTVSRWTPGDGIKNISSRRLNFDRQPLGIPVNPVLDRTDPLVLSQMAASAQGTEHKSSIESAANLTVFKHRFEGQYFTGANPADATGDVGLKYYIHSINGLEGAVFSAYDKITGSIVSGPIDMDSLGSDSCADGAGQSIVLFDEMAERWLMSELSSTGSHLCVYISQTSDPIVGGWFAYSFAAPTFVDYPKYGIGADAYYVGTNEATPAMYALDRNAMLAGNDASMVRIAADSLAGFDFQIMQPVDHEGSVDMPAGTPGYFLRHRDDEIHNSNTNDPIKDYLELWQMQVDWDNPSNSTFTKVVDLEIAEFDSDLCGLDSVGCFPQTGTYPDLASLREVVMFRAQYRNFDSYETIVGNFVTDVNGTDQGGIRWFELRRENGSWNLHQEGTYAPDDKNRWMGSIAMDKAGNIALAYSWTSLWRNDLPGLRYTGRLGSDPLGVMTEAESVIVHGYGGNDSSLWGGFSHLALDPVDECTFWYTNQWASDWPQWQPHISSFKFDHCGEGSIGNNQPPVASFTYVCDGYHCDFDANASNDSDGTIESYDWDFDTWLTGTGVTSSTYLFAYGTHTVTLTVTDNEGATHAINKNIEIINPYDLKTDGRTHESLALERGEILSFHIDVPPGAIALDVETSGGLGNVDLAIKSGSVPSADSYDCRQTGAGNAHICSIPNPQSDTWYIIVRGEAASNGVQLDYYWKTEEFIPPIADFSYSVDGLKVSFTDTSTDSDGTVLAWQWWFGDGPGSPSPNPTHTYPSTGTYNVSFTVTDNNGAKNTIIRPITLVDGGESGGYTETDLSLARGEVLNYTLDVPAGATSLIVDTLEGAGDVDLTIKFDATPTPADNDCYQTGPGNSHNCTISNPQQGIWYIIVRGAAPSTDVQLNAYWFE